MQIIYKQSLASPESEHQVESGLLLDVVVRQCASVLQLLSSEDQSLLIGGNALLVLDLGLHVLDCVRGLNVQGDGLPSQSLHEDLHSTSESENQMKSRFLLDVVVTKSSSIFKLLACKDESLLIRRDAFLVLNLSLDIVDCV